MGLVKVSPLARKPRVAASLMDGEIDCLNLVFSFDILSPIFSKDIRNLLESSWQNSWIQIHLLTSGYPKGQVHVCALPRITDAPTNVWAFHFYCAHGAIQGTRTLRQELTPVTWREMTPDRPARCGHDSLYRGSVRAVPQQWIRATEIQPRNNDSQHWVRRCTRHNMFLWLLFLFMFGLRGEGLDFRRLNVSETATHVTGHCVSQQCQMWVRNCAFVHPSAWNLL
jgi:hypothetical protein